MQETMTQNINKSFQELERRTKEDLMASNAIDSFELNQNQRNDEKHASRKSNFRRLLQKNVTMDKGPIGAKILVCINDFIAIREKIMFLIQMLLSEILHLP